MGRSTKPIRVEKQDAEQIQDLAEEYDTRPAEIFGTVLAHVDLDEIENKTVDKGPVGACPLCGYEFEQTEVKDPMFGDPQVSCPDPEDRHQETGVQLRFRVEELDNV
jgi:hypothetical protein